MIVLVSIFAYLFLHLCRAQYPGRWNFGKEGMSNVTVFMQTKIIYCRVNIASEFENIGPSLIFERQVWLPPGEFPLSLYCNDGTGLGSLRATVYVDGVITEFEWSVSADPAPPFPQYALSCPAAWSSTENSTLMTRSRINILPAISVWTCRAASTRTQYTLNIIVPSRSPTARKVKFALAADDELSNGNIGAYTFVKTTNWVHVMAFSLYLEPGIYPYRLIGRDTGGGSFIASAISVDNSLVTTTNDRSGWEVALNNNRSSSLQTNFVFCGQDPYISSQFKLEMNTTISFIWPKCYTQGLSYFRYYLDIKPRSPSNYLKIDFQFSATGQFAMQVGSQYPTITTGTRGLAQNFSLYLLPEIYVLKFTMGADNNGSQSALIGHISSQGQLIAATNGYSGRWTLSSGLQAQSCAYQQLDLDGINEIWGSAISLVELIGVSALCSSNGEQYSITYILDLTSRTSSTPANLLSRPSSSLISATIPSRKSLEGSPTSFETPENWLSLNAKSASKSLAIISNLKPAAPIISTVVGYIYTYFLYAIAVAGVLAVLVCSGCLLLYQKWKGANKEKPYRQSDLDGVTDFNEVSDNPPTTTIMTANTTIITTNTTMFGTDMDRSFSIPGYMNTVNERDFKITKKLGNGGGGDIFFAQAIASSLREFGDNIIVKKIRFSDDVETSQLRFHQELSVTSYLQSCPNIIRLLGYCDDPTALILKIYPLGSLGTLINSRPVMITKKISHSFIRDVATGLNAIHSAGFVHSDIKSDNILIDIDQVAGKYFCVICDFGISQVVSPKVLKVGAFVVANQMGLSLWYAAPEVFRDMRAGRTMRKCSSDVYAFGVLGVEMLSMGKARWS
eukprot:Partr_v1_DN28963_c0_g1_i2_m25365 putative protein kinase kinase kinase